MGLGWFVKRHSVLVPELKLRFPDSQYSGQLLLKPQGSEDIAGEVRLSGTMKVPTITEASIRD